MRIEASAALALCAALAAAASAPGGSGGARWRVEPVGEIARPAPPGSTSMGGIAWVSNDVYWAVTDWNPVVWEMSVPADPKTGGISGCSLSRRCVPQDALDVEAMAIDPLDGSLWIADERSNRITRHDPSTGRRMGQADLPPVMAGIRQDLGLESLAISGDGLVMWTATEEALAADGPRSTKARGSDVRLTRLSRKGAGDAWRASGQWAYLTDPIAGEPWAFHSRNMSRSGLSELCLLEDGTLLALEREFSKVVIPRLRCRIYEVCLDGATDVSSAPSVAEARGLVRAKKHLLFETKGLSMYEGMCVGPRLADGSRLLLLVSDGDSRSLSTLFALRLGRR